MGRGVLLERQGRRGIVLTPEGVFRQVRLDRACEVGQEIDFPDRERAPVARWALAAAVVAAAVLLPFLKPLFLPPPAVALVSVDINPSVELWVTAQARVRTARALNADGERLLGTVRFRGRPVQEVVADLTAGAYRLGYLHAGASQETVLITIAPAEGASVPPGQVEDLHEAVYRAAESAVRTHRGAARVQTLQATEAERAAAEKLGVSPGRYLLYEELQAERPGTRLEPGAIQRLRPSDVSKALGADTVADLLERIRERQEEKGVFPGRSPDDPPPPARRGPGGDRGGEIRVEPPLPRVPGLDRVLAPLREFRPAPPSPEREKPDRERGDKDREEEKDKEKELEREEEKGNKQQRVPPGLRGRLPGLERDREEEREESGEARRGRGGAHPARLSQGKWGRDSRGNPERKEEEPDRPAKEAARLPDGVGPPLEDLLCGGACGNRRWRLDGTGR